MDHDRLRLPFGVALAPFAVALAAALLVSSQTYLSMLDHGHSWPRMFLWQLGAWIFWAAVAPPLLRAAGRPIPRRRRGGQLALHLVAAMALTGVHVLWTSLLTLALQPWEPVSTLDLQGALRSTLMPWAYVGMLAYGLLAASGYALASRQRERDRELRQSRLEAELARAQLDALRLELQPHFLFNSLHSIAALMRAQESERALQMLLNLGELLRTTLERSHRPMIPLDEELAVLRRYVELQQVRFSDRLQVSWQIDERARDRPVPTLLLQPLVENALRHGLAPRARGGTIEVWATALDDATRLEVQDDGIGLPAEFRPGADDGVGLRNTRARLESLCGTRARLEIGSRSGGGTRVAVTLPAMPSLSPLGDPA